ncbi:MAG: FtsW/RodA/SpoVE family cell cycle protein [Candidatus Aminicenantes bacterium]|nr:FtsW/RodA/SpoVE family cell cycle protein [Candidatus Aminicenantes bacterium]
MKFIMVIILYGCWMLWLVLSYFFLLFKRGDKIDPSQSVVESNESGFALRSFWGMLLSTMVLLTLFFLLCRDYQSGAFFYIEKYIYSVDKNKKSIVIGDDKEHSDITIENVYADGSHLKLIPEEESFKVENISATKKADVNGRYLRKLVIRTGDEVEINGNEKIRVIRINQQYPLGRSITLSITSRSDSVGKLVTIPTFLTKSITLRYGPGSDIRTGFDSMVFPARESKIIATLAHEMNTTFMGLNIYYFIVFLTVLLISVAIYLYLKNQFNGGLLVFMLVSLPFLAGFVSFSSLLIVFLGFIPFILFIQVRRRTRWKPASFFVLLSFISIFFLPEIINIKGDFTLTHRGAKGSNSILIKRENISFYLDENSRKLAYQQDHEVILGYTRYLLNFTKNKIFFSPVNPERIKASDKTQGIINTLDQVKPGKSYIYLKFPHHFDPISNETIQNNIRMTIKDSSGNAVVISRIENDNYAMYSSGLFFIIVSFWLFWIMNAFGFTIGRFHFFRFNLLNRSNFFVFNFVYFMLCLGYIMLGVLSLYNNYFLKNFEKFRSRAVFWFIVLLFSSLIISRYNKLLVFFYRVFKKKNFLVPLLIGFVFLFLSALSKLFAFIGIGYFIFVFLIRLRKDLIYEYQNSYNHPLVLKDVNEKPITHLNRIENQRIFFGLGRVLYQQGWDYITTSDLLLLLSLFFIVLQVFLGGELGVSVGGFFFLPVEIGKILLTVYFADWVSRIDKGMKLNVLWIYGLVLIPFLLLIVFLKDFSPLLVFSFVFLYHIIKIKKSILFKITLIVLLLSTLSISVFHINNYCFPFSSSPFNIIFTLVIVLMIMVALLRIWIGKYSQQLKTRSKLFITVCLMVILIVPNAVIWHFDISVPKVLGDRISSWLNPWRDYNLSYQYINSLWLMKGCGLLGKPAEALESAAKVPLIEQDLSFSLYVSVLGMTGVLFIFLTLLMLVIAIHRLVVRFRDGPLRWDGYVLEFLTVIFSAQFIFPALYVVGLLPIMSQPLPFLSYSNNMLLLFAYPFAFLIMVLINNMEKR